MHYTYEQMEQKTTFQVSEQLWTDYRQQLYFFVLKRVSDPHIAEDIVQDVLLKAFTNQDSLQDDTKIEAWLYQITRNAITDYYRSHKDAGALPDENLLPEAGKDADVRQELAECCIRPFVARLPTPYKEAVTLSELDGLTQAEVAQKQGLSLSGAKSRVQRGRQLLKGALLQCCQFEIDQQGKVTDFAAQKQCNGC